MIRKSLFVLLFSFFFLLTVFSENAANGEKKEAKFVIRNVSYTIDGKTRESVLSHYLDIKSGESFTTKEELEVYLADKIQLIHNQLSLAEGNIKTVYVKDSDNSDITFTDLNIYVRDSWNYILLPYPKYDSNDGFLLSLRGRNYNFLGGMEKLSLNLDYQISPSGDSEYSFNGGSAIPFYLWGYNWKFSFDENMIISQDNPFELYTKAGVSVDIPLDHLTWRASVDQLYSLNEDGESDADGYYMKTAASFESLIPTGIEIPFLGEVTYDPGIVTSYAYKPFDSLSEERKGYELGGRHGISAGRINWFGNFRNGIIFSADQDLLYNFTRELWMSNFDFELQMHRALGWGGLSSRILGFYKYNSDAEDIEDLGDPIRGILNSRISGDAGIFINMDFPVKLWIWFLDRWFEGHLSPFFDYALVRPEDGGFSFKDGWYGAGLEGFAFFKAARSIYLRVSVGLDMEAILEGSLPGDSASRDGESIYEIFIGLGHHY